MSRTDKSVGTVMLGDCVPLMSRLDAQSVDFVLTDPGGLPNLKGNLSWLRLQH